MKKTKNFFKKILFPPAWIILLLTLISAISLTVIFMNDLDSSTIAYAVYALSAYSLTVLCIFLAIVLPRSYKEIKQRIYNTKYGHRYMTDSIFKTQVSLYLSLALNLLYAVMKLYIGIGERSAWFITLAAYYILLALMRFFLLRHMQKNKITKNKLSEWKRYLFCGAVLMAMNLVLSYMVALVIVNDGGFTYDGYMIYLMAAYAFYKIIMAVISILKYRKYKSPILSASKAIGFAAALVSMLALEIAMLTQFGGENDSPLFNQRMIGATGAGVCSIVIGMATYMIVRSTKEIRQLNFNNSQT